MPLARLNHKFLQLSVARLSNLLLADYMKLPELDVVEDARLVWIIFGSLTEVEPLVKRAVRNNDRVLIAHGSPRKAGNGSTRHIRSDGVCSMGCDIREFISVKEAVDQCIQLFGSIDIVVDWTADFPNWGLPEALASPDIGIKQTQQITVDVFAHMDLELVGIFNIIRATMPFLSSSSPYRQDHDQQYQQQMLSKIMVMSDSLACQSLPGFSAKCGVRRAVEGMMECFAFESSEDNVQSVIIDLGLKATDESDLAEKLFHIGHSANVPERIPLTDAAIQIARDKLRNLAEEIEDWKFLSEEGNGTDDN